MRKPITQVLSSLSMAVGNDSISKSPLLFSRPLSRPVSLIIYDLFSPVPTRMTRENGIPTHLFLPSSLSVFFLLIRVSEGNTYFTNLKPRMAQQILDALSLADGIISNSVDRLEKQIRDKLHLRMANLLNRSVRFVAPLIPAVYEESRKEKVTVKLYFHHFDKFRVCFKGHHCIR